MALCDDCASGVHEACENCECNCHGLILTMEEAKALTRVVGVMWIDRDDPEAMLVVDKVCQFANAPLPIKPLEKKS